MNVSFLNRLPRVVRADVHRGPSVRGSFIDEEWVLHYIQAGFWTFELGSKIYDIAPGDLVLIPPRLLHVVRPTGGKRQIQWVVHFDWLEGPVSPDAFPYAVAADKAVRRKIRQIFPLLLGSDTKSDRLFQAGLTAALLGLFASLTSPEKPFRLRTAGSWETLEKAIRFLQRNFAEKNIQLADACRAAGLSVPYFCRVFKENSGLSAMRYLTLFRLQKAEQFLLGSTLNCTEIAEKVGFESVHSLSRVFRREKGMSPTHYRKLHGC